MTMCPEIQDCAKTADQIRKSQVGYSIREREGAHRKIRWDLAHRKEPGLVDQ